MKIHSRLLIASMISFFAMSAGSHAEEATLDAKAAGGLISNHTWEQPQAHGTGKIYWSWKSEGSVCLRTDGRTGKCADTGRWKLDGGRLCYELTWWGKSVGRNAACFRIVDKGAKRYEALQDNGLTLFEFSVVE